MSEKTPPPTPEQTAMDSNTDVERLKQELAQAKDQYLRAQAEFENTKKRLQRDKDEFVKFAAESMARDLLPVLDSLDQALVAVDKQQDTQGIIKGVHLIHRQLLGLLHEEGVSRIPTVGEPFDPHRHEAVGHVEPTNGQAEGAIAEEVHAGYMMHGKVLRPAMVKIVQAIKLDN